MKKVIDMTKIKVGDIIETWSQDKDYIILARVDTVDKIRGKIFVEVEDHSNKCFMSDIFAHYVLVSK